MLNGTDVSFGTDPEVVVLDRKTNQPVPAHLAGFPPPTNKQNLDRGSVFRDGYMVEINVPPANCRETMLYSMRSVQEYLRKSLAKRGLCYATIPAVTVDLGLLKNAPEDVRTFGCNPSFCAYDEVQKVPEIDALKHPMRYAGAHLHFGVPKRFQWFKNSNNWASLIKLLDMYVGLPLTIMHHRPQQYQRRLWYGQAGEFRPQTYSGGIGIEYRTPGPEVWNHEAIASFAMGAGRWVIHNFRNLLPMLKAVDPQNVRKAINTGMNRRSVLMSVEMLTPKKAQLPYHLSAIANGIAAKRLFAPKGIAQYDVQGISEWAVKWDLQGTMDECGCCVTGDVINDSI